MQQKHSSQQNTVLAWQNSMIENKVIFLISKQFQWFKSTSNILANLLKINTLNGKTYPIWLSCKILAFCSTTSHSFSLICNFWTLRLVLRRNHKKSVTQPKNRKPIGNEAELRYQFSFGKKNCLTIIGKNLFATPGPLTFFFWPLYFIFMGVSNHSGSIKMDVAYINWPI